MFNSTIKDYLEYAEIAVSTKNALCSTCNGEGVTGNPAFNGMSLNDAEPEFWNEYFKADSIYDVVCHECNGDKVIKEYNLSELNAAQRADLDSYLADIHLSYLEQAAEIRAGC